MKTDFIIILDPEIDEGTGELILVASKLNDGDSEKDMEYLGVFTGTTAEGIIDILLGMNDKEDKEDD